MRIPAGDVTLEGDLVLPVDDTGVVLFAHGSGSSRHSPRNRYVAGTLQEAGLGTLLVDLLTGEEEQVDLQTRELRFDIQLLARRLIGIIDWLAGNQATAHRPAGLFGASTGGGAALVAAAERPQRVGAVVSRGGRPDLAGASLGHVQSPTLLIVGSLDPHVLELNQEAFAQIPGAKDLAIVAGATHLFEEPGKLEEVSALARDWFTTHLGAKHA